MQLIWWGEVWCWSLLGLKGLIINIAKLWRNPYKIPVTQLLQQLSQTTFSFCFKTTRLQIDMSDNVILSWPPAKFTFVTSSLNGNALAGFIRKKCFIWRHNVHRLSSPVILSPDIVNLFLTFIRLGIKGQLSIHYSNLIQFNTPGMPRRSWGQ